jgi:hypothetical protein
MVRTRPSGTGDNRGEGWRAAPRRGAGRAVKSPRQSPPPTAACTGLAAAPSLPYVGRLACALGVVFLAGAGGTALIRAGTAFEHGWWLVAYLALVGGISQLLLGTGTAWIRSQSCAPARNPRWPRSELVLWNVGMLVVPVGVFIDRDAPVLAGSALLLRGLILFATGLPRSLREATAAMKGWERAYLAVVPDQRTSSRYR